jgi:hypothetical protein
VQKEALMAVGRNLLLVGLMPLLCALAWRKWV